MPRGGGVKVFAAGFGGGVVLLGAGEGAARGGGEVAPMGTMASPSPSPYGSLFPRLLVPARPFIGVSTPKPTSNESGSVGEFDFLL